MGQQLCWQCSLRLHRGSGLRYEYSRELILNCLFAATLLSSSGIEITQAQRSPTLTAELDESGQQVVIRRAGAGEPLVTQHARPDFRPYLHPLVAPDGNGILTEVSPHHHKHQTGV